MACNSKANIKALSLSSRMKRRNLCRNPTTHDKYSSALYSPLLTDTMAGVDNNNHSRHPHHAASAKAAGAENVKEEEEIMKGIIPIHSRRNSITDALQTLNVSLLSSISDDTYISYLAPSFSLHASVW